MAIKIFEKFTPRANPADGNYPYGSIKNESVPGAKDGTPLDAEWGNDYAGFDAALLAEANIVPNGAADTAVASQRLQAMNNVIKKQGLTVFDTVADMQAGAAQGVTGGKITLSLGQYVRLMDRDGEVFQITNDVANGYDKIDTTTGVTASYAKLTQISDLAFGLKNDDTDEEAALTAFFNSTYNVLFLKGNWSGNNYKSSKTIVCGVNKEIFWGNVILESITGVDTGGVIAFLDGSVVYNPKVDGGGTALIAGGSGQNGYGFQGKVTGFNFFAQNCARGNTAPFDGGKGLQSEDESADVTIYGLTAVNCHMAASSRKDGVTGTGNHLKIYGLKAKSCNHVTFSQISNSSSRDPKDFTAKYIGVEVEDCGSLDAFTGADAGLFLFSRAANVTHSCVTISGTAKVEGIFRGRSRSCTATGVRVNQPCIGLVNIDPDTLYALDTTLPEENHWDIDVDAALDYALFSDLSDVTHANRFVVNSQLTVRLKNDVVTSLVTPATRNGNCFLSLKMGTSKIDARAGIINASYANMAVANSLTENREVVKIGQALNGGVDASQTRGVILDNLFETVNSSVTGTPYFAPLGDNVNPLGLGPNRWKEVFAGTGTINTSDEREKQDIRSLNKKEMAVGRKLKSMVKAYRWIDAAEKKGDSARIHCGFIAQEVRDAFESEGLDPFSYGALCFDKWEDRVGEDGRVITEAGDRFGIRHDQILSFIIASL